MSSPDNSVDLKVAAIACADRISEQYGRKDVPAITDLASSLLSHGVEGSTNSSIHAAALICLASILEVLREAAIPFVPHMVEKVLGMWDESMATDRDDPILHNACISVLVGVATHVHFMLLDDHLHRILGLCAMSTTTQLDEESHSSRRDFMQLLSKKLDLKQTIASSRKVWDEAVENGIEDSTKSAVVKLAEDISTVFLLAADLRRVQLTHRSDDSYNEEEVEEVEGKLKDILIKFVYKLNDSIFRPMFSQWVEWAVECSDVQLANLDRSKMLRQTTLFNLLTHFFSTLKSTLLKQTHLPLQNLAQTKIT